MVKLGYIGICSDGTKIHIAKYPRKELCEYFGVKHAEKMYVGDEKGLHIGYVIAGRWITVYEIHEWKD